MNTRILKISAFCLALLLLFCVGWFANGLLGNPVSHMLARRTAEAHLAEHYPNTDYILDTVSYNLKDFPWVDIDAEDLLARIEACTERTRQAYAAPSPGRDNKNPDKHLFIGVFV